MLAPLLGPPVAVLLSLFPFTAGGTAVNGRLSAAIVLLDITVVGRLVVPLESNGRAVSAKATLLGGFRDTPLYTEPVVVVVVVDVDELNAERTALFAPDKPTTPTDGPG